MQRLANTINKLTTNRLLGLPIFLLVMYSLFFFTVGFGGALQPFFDLSSKALFVELPAAIIQNLNFPQWLECIILHGLGKGISVTITFIPILTCMFFCLSFLEYSGYIARAAYVMHNFMSYLGLPGKSFIPMIIGFGCNVPAIAGTNILNKKQEKILTIMMIPFISCGSKLTIYAIFVAAFFEQSGQNIVFLLYLTGVGLAIFTGLMLKNSLFTQDICKPAEEFPALKFPNLWLLASNTLSQVKSFLIKSGSVIIILCIIIGGLSNIKINAISKQDTILEAIGKNLSPIFAPMGITQDNWQAVVGLLTGVLAKEVIIGTLNTLYEQENMHSLNKNNSVKDNTQQLLDQQSPEMHNDEAQQNRQDNQNSKSINISLQISKDANTSLSFALLAALKSIPENLVQLKDSFFHPFSFNPPNKKVDNKILNTIYSKFNNSAAAFSYLLFILLYCPCVSVVIMIMRELGRKWALFSVFWTTGLAYVIAVAFYQIFTVINMLSAIVWAIGLLASIMSFIYLFKLFVCKQEFADPIRVIPSKISYSKE